MSIRKKITHFNAVRQVNSTLSEMMLMECKGGAHMEEAMVVWQSSVPSGSVACRPRGRDFPHK